MSKKKLSFSFHSLLSSSLYIFSYSLYFSLLSCLLSLTQLFKAALVLTLWDFHFFSSLWDFHFFSPLHWPNGLFIYFFIFSFFFLPFTLFTSSHNKCKPLTLTLLQPKSLPLHWPNGLACFFPFSFQLCHTRITMPFTSFFSFLSSFQHVWHKFNIT